MKRFRFAILAALLACTAQARTLYVSTTGSHKYGSATDATTNANHGLPVGGVTASTNSPFAGERSAAFDGASGAVYMYPPIPNLANDFTVELWAYRNKQALQYMFYQGDSAATAPLVGISDQNTSAAEFVVRSANNTLIKLRAGTFQTTNWVHLALVWRAGEKSVRGYINGVQVGGVTNASADDTTFSIASFGNHRRLGSHWFDGNISDVRIWNVARTPEQIAENYTNRLTGTEEGLVGYWPLDDGEDLYSFKTPATAATNIQAAIEASSSGDTVRVAPGTYFSDNGTNHIIAITNKTGLSVIGGHGTLFDADRTILDAGGSASARPIYVNTASNLVAGFTAMNTKAEDAVLLYVSSVNCTLDSLIVRNNDMSATTWGCGIKNLGGPGNEIRNCIVVGNGVGTDSRCAGIENQKHSTGVGISRVANCVVEANTKAQLVRSSGTLTVANTIHGNVGGTIVFSGGNLTSNTTNSVMRALDIAPASEGVGTNLVWRGVSAYIPRLGSLARKNGQPYAGIETASDGAGGPALVAIRPFFGRDVSTNRNHGAAVGGVTSAADSPFSGERSAAFDGASAAIDLGSTIGAKLVGATNITIESWVSISGYMANAPALNVNVTNTTAAGLYVGSYQGKLSFIGRSSPADSGQIVSLDAGGPTNAWTHFAATVDIPGDKVVLYVNGAASKTGAVSFGKTSYSGAAVSLSAGIGWNGATSFWNGKISDARIWNVARTPEQIAASYTNRLTGTEEGLVGYWPLKDPAINPTDTGPFNLDNPTIHPTYLEAF